MNIRMLAIAPDDGWAFVVEKGKTYAIRPPYLESNLVEVSDRSVEQAVELYGFERHEKDFDSFVSLVRYLQDEYVKTKRANGIDLPSSGTIRGLLKFADDNTIWLYLKRATKELIPKGKFDGAVMIANQLAKLEKVKHNPEMQKMTNEIYEKYCERQIQLRKLTPKIPSASCSSWRKKFPDVAKRFSLTDVIEYQKAVTSEGQVLPITGEDK